MTMAVELSVELDRSAPEPLYQQLADQLRAALDAGARVHICHASTEGTATGEQTSVDTPANEPDERPTSDGKEGQA